MSQNGKVGATSDLVFISSTVVDLENSSETILYELSAANSSNGYYTFNLPYGCLIEPILYVKNGSSGFDSSLIRQWLESVGRDGTGCSDEVQVTILGFTNSYYTDIPLSIPGS